MENNHNEKIEQQGTSIDGIYTHYKGKKYRVLGLVRHSETLEELVLYNCCYENDLGKTWVRPKELFFSNVEINGKTQPRFKKAPTK